nr:transmembrane 9 superfamily member 4-like [Tanacetum cinerariifolium]
MDDKRNSNNVEEDQVADNQEETRWKMIHGDVFRFLNHKSLLAAALGSGTHLLQLCLRARFAASLVRSDLRIDADSCCLSSANNCNTMQIAEQNLEWQEDEA